MNMNILKSNLGFIKLIYSFFLARSISCIFIIFLLPLYDKRLFVFTDLATYQETPDGSFIFTPNFLFGYLIRLVGYDSNNIHNPVPIIICFVFSIIIFLPWLILANKILNKKAAIFYSLAIGFHPYLALYSLKIDSTAFAFLPVAFFAIEKFLNIYRFKLISFWTTVISSYFRSQMVILGWIQVLFFLPKKNFRISRINFSFLIAFVLLLFCSISQYNYGSEIVTQNFGCYSFLNIKIFFNDLGFNDLLSNLLSLLFTPILHFLLLLGAREAISFKCLFLPKDIASNSFLNIFSTFSFFIFHLFLICKMIIWILKSNSKKTFKLLIPFSLLLPNLYGASHMRYFMCLIPYLMLWLFDIKNDKYFQN